MTRTTTPELLQLDPAQIQAHPRNPRQAVTDLAGLVDSIAQVGILEPVVVAPWPTDLYTSSKTRQDGYVLIAGHRRVAAAKKAKVKVLALHRPDLDTLAAQIEAMLVENLHRADLSPIEEGDAYQGLLDLGISQADIATKVGRPKRTVSERVRVAGIPGPAREKLHAHQITIDAALAIAEFKGDTEAQERLIHFAGSGSWDPVLRDLRARKTAQATRVKTRKALEQAGVKVLDDFPDDPDIEGTDDVEPWEHVGDLDLAEMTNEAQVMAHAGKDADDLTWDDYEAWHAAKCDGHAVVDVGRVHPQWTQHANEPIFDPICTTPAVHEFPERTPTGASTFKEEQERREHLRAASVRRRDHLVRVVSDPPPGTATHILKRYLHQAVTQSDYSKAPLTSDHYTPVVSGRADLLGIPADVPREHLTPARFAEALVATIDGQPLERLVVLLAALQGIGDEPGLVHAYWSGGPNSTDAKWITDLTQVWGYDWSDFELSRIPDDLRTTLELPGLDVDPGAESVEATAEGAAGGEVA